MGYAKLFVELSVAKPPPKIIDIQLEDGEKIQLQVEYEWIPPHSHKCSSFGHLTCQCPVKEKWVPKEAHVAEAGIDSDGDTIDEEMETCDTHKTSGQNRDDASY